MKITFIAVTALAFAGIAQAQNVEREYAQVGNWTVHYQTDASGKFLQASMIRDSDGSMLRMAIDDKHFHVDTAGKDWDSLGDASFGRKATVQLVLPEQAELGGLSVEGTIVDVDGDKWLRFSDPLDEPSSLQDLIRNGQTLNVVFPDGRKWTFSLKGSHTAWKKVEEAESKFKN